MQSTPVKSGFVVVAGRPSSGKSTLLNALCGAKVSIVSPVPQTTRNTVRGIVNRPQGQIVFLDTPGFHQAERKMNLRLRQVVLDQLAEADAVLYLVDTTREAGEEEQTLAAAIKAAGKPVIAVLSKCDKPDSDAARARAFLQRAFAAADESHGAIGAAAEEPVVTNGEPSSAGLHAVVEAAVPPHRTPSGLDALTEALFAQLPEGAPYYPAEYYTDQEVSFRIAELLREQVMNLTHEEVPHATFVEIADIEQREVDEEGQPTALWVRAFIYVERDSQKGIVVGAGGRVIRAIRTRAQAELAKIFDYPIHINVQVKVKPKWRHNDDLLRKLIT